MDKDLRAVTVEHMKKAVEHLSHELSTIRTGRASASLLDTIKVNYYGTPTPLNHVANISVPDSKTIMIQPFQQNLIGDVEKAIQASDLGLTPNSDGHVIRLPIPQLTEERRKDILKLVKKLGEDTKVAIRNIRRDAIEKMRVMKKDSKITEDDLHRGEKEAQEITDKHITEVDQVIAVKEKEVMTV
ncbi:ribosome recycling factor [bacterium]|nr:ribosome recycling factor [bacterium]